MKGLVVEADPGSPDRSSANRDRRAIFAAHRAFEQVELFRLPVVHALKLEAVADRPVHGKRADAEHALQLVRSSSDFSSGDRTCS